jgi:hypothetical protein
MQVWFDFIGIVRTQALIASQWAHANLRARSRQQSARSRKTTSLFAAKMTTIVLGYFYRLHSNQLIQAGDF